MNESLEAAFGRGFSLHIFPFDQVRWGAVELSTLESKLSYTQDFIELPGISRIQHRIAKSRSIRMETEANEGTMMVFESYKLLENWLKSRCNELWPNCSFCGRRFQADEVICVGCGGPRGE